MNTENLPARTRQMTWSPAAVTIAPVTVRVADRAGGPDEGLRSALVWLLVAALPMVGLASLLWHARFDPHWSNPRVHFGLFATAGTLDFVLASAAGSAARRRGDSRVLLISLTFLITGGFLALHALGTPGVLFADDRAGFKVAVPVGLAIGGGFALASAFTSSRVLARHQRALVALVAVLMAVWFVWSAASLPPLDGPIDEGAPGSLLPALAAAGAAAYLAAAWRYVLVFRASPSPLAAAVAACFVLLGEAMIGVALTGERDWHASWWEWHGLILIAFATVGLAARREWRDERFRSLYLPTTVERTAEISVLFADLVAFTTFTERTPASETAGMLKTYFELAAPVIARHGGRIEHFIGDGVMATFNAHDELPQHALSATRAALELRDGMAGLTAAHPGWPALRVGINSGPAVVREMGGAGHVAYTVVGDCVNVGSRLEAAAAAGAILIGADTYRRLPDGTPAEPRPGLAVRGREGRVDAFVLHSLT